ncbi:conserved protein of unknown function, might belong to Kynureninase [Shewanella benthica]|uniref:Uncharacterized protein n=1 Tax=Shewanella benthica TaxID=43661 RepID=A0A330M4P8_9GAMM|nr:hypothetical protein [Shewanella benthica]SQH76020.1 conserved protein of unknown function, might belong to Kynureninase [Shewanella benthica]
MPDFHLCAGFLSLTTAKASDWVAQLAERGILCDSRGDQLRFGPAPYVSKAQLHQALNVVEDLAKGLV